MNARGRVGVLSGLLVAMFALTSAECPAGPFADALGRKLVESTTHQDKAVLVRWMFTAMSLHPDLKELSVVTKADRDASNKAFATLATRLLTRDCLKEARDAVMYEGPVAIETAFQVLGQVAGREIFSDKSVAAELADLDKYMDAAAIDKALGRANPAGAEK